MTKRVQGGQAAWKEHTGAGLDPTQRAILPVFDVTTDGSGPGLVYKVAAGSPAAVIVALGRNLADIVSVEVGTSVQVGVVQGAPPAVVTLLALDGAVSITLDCTPCTPDDYWGLILRDSDGNAYAAPSPIKIFDPPPP